MSGEMTSAPRWQKASGRKPGVERVSGRWRLVVELEHYGYYSWAVQIDTGLIQAAGGGVKRRLPGDVTSQTQWVGVETGHTPDGIAVAMQAAENAAATLRAEMEGL